MIQPAALDGGRKSAFPENGTSRGRSQEEGGGVLFMKPHGAFRKSRGGVLAFRLFIQPDIWRVMVSGDAQANVAPKWELTHVLKAGVWCEVEGTMPMQIKAASSIHHSRGILSDYYHDHYALLRVTLFSVMDLNTSVYSKIIFRGMGRGHQYSCMLYLSQLRAKLCAKVRRCDAAIWLANQRAG